MIEHEYGSEEYFSDLFSDIIADLETEGNIRNVMAGFEKAIGSWLEYHEQCSSRYRELHRRFLLGDLD